MYRLRTERNAIGSRRTFLARSLGLAASFSMAGLGARAKAPVTIFAAASTAGAIEAVAKDFEALNAGSVRAVFAASSTGRAV